MNKIFHLNNDKFIILCLGLCPAIFLTTTFENGYLMGLMILVVTVLSNLLVSIISIITKGKYVLIISILLSSLLVTILDYLMLTYSSNISESLGIFIPLIAINYVVLHKSFSLENSNFKEDIITSLKMGAIFALMLSLIGLIREFLGSNTITIMDKVSDITGYISVYKILPANDFIPNELFLTSAGAFLIMGLMIGIINSFRKGDVK